MIILLILSDGLRSSYGPRWGRAFLEEAAAFAEDSETDREDGEAECDGGDANGGGGKLEESMAAVAAAVGDEQEYAEGPINQSASLRMADVIPAAFRASLGHRLHCGTPVGLRCDRELPYI